MRPTSFRALVSVFRAGMKHGGDHADRVLQPAIANLVGRATPTNTTPAPEDNAPTRSIEGTAIRVERGTVRLTFLLLLAASAAYLIHLPDFGLRPQLHIALDEDQVPKRDLEDEE